MSQELCPRCGVPHEMRTTAVTRTVTAPDGTKKRIRTDSSHCTSCGQFVSSKEIEESDDQKAVSE
jgi:predicted RNA-binding Zn-ribbon protein involved in translation (DUF1610 family)